MPRASADGTFRTLLMVDTRSISLVTDVYASGHLPIDVDRGAYRFPAPGPDPQCV